MADGAGGAGLRMLIEKRRKARFIADQQETRLWMPLSREGQTLNHHVRGIIPAHGVDRQIEGHALSDWARLFGIGHERGRARSGANGNLKRLASAHDLTAIIMAAMAADMVRALQLAAVAAFGKARGAQGMVRAAHATAGR